MPGTATKKKAGRDLAEGKAPSTAAGEFVREEIHHIREGKHGATSATQAVAIGLSKARRAGVPAKPASSASEHVKPKARAEATRVGKATSPRRARASLKARKREPQRAASAAALSRQAKASATRRRNAGAGKAPRAVARRAAQTRKRRAGASQRRPAR